MSYVPEEKMGLLQTREQLEEQMKDTYDAKRPSDNPAHRERHGLEGAYDAQCAEQCCMPKTPWDNADPWIQWPKPAPPADPKEEKERLDKLAEIIRKASKKPEDAPKASIRSFSTGATRDTDEGKNDYEGFLSPLVIEAYGDYMTEHRRQSDGTLRDSDNWQKGIPRTAYMKSLLRHVLDLWKLHRGYSVKPEMRGGIWVPPTKRSLLCSILFNTMGYLHELLKEELGNQQRAA